VLAHCFEMNSESVTPVLLDGSWWVDAAEKDITVGLATETIELRPDRPFTSKIFALKLASKSSAKLTDY